VYLGCTLEKTEADRGLSFWKYIVNSVKLQKYDARTQLATLAVEISLDLHLNSKSLPIRKKMKMLQKLSMLAFLFGSTLFSSTALKIDVVVAQPVTPPTFTANIDPRQTFTNADTSAFNSVILDLTQLGIQPGDTIVLERFGYFSPFGDSTKEYYGSIFATFSTDSRLLPNSGIVNGVTTERVPGAISAQFPNGCG
jgi:hypothetical protein